MVYDLFMMTKLKKDLLDCYLYFQYFLLTVCLTFGTLLYLITISLFYSFEQEFQHISTSTETSFLYNFIYYTLIYAASILVPVAAALICRKIIKKQYLNNSNIAYLIFIIFLEIIIAFKCFFN